MILSGLFSNALRRIPGISIASGGSLDAVRFAWTVLLRFALSRIRQSFLYAPSAGAYFGNTRRIQRFGQRAIHSFPFSRIESVGSAAGVFSYHRRMKDAILCSTYAQSNISNNSQQKKQINSLSLNNIYK